MAWQYPDNNQNGQTLMTFSASGNWTLDGNGRISAERLVHGSAMGIKLNGLSGTHVIACALIYQDKVYFGRSNHELRDSDLPQSLKDVMRHRSSERHSVINCAEIEALAAAVADGYNPQNMGAGVEVRSCRTDNAQHYRPCDNCIMLLGLANYED